LIHSSLPDGVAICSESKTLFWTEMGHVGHNDGAVWRSNLDGSDPQYLMPPGVCHTPKQISLDQISRKVYVADREGLRIHSANYDGTGHEVIVQTGDYEVDVDRNNPHLWCVGVAVSRKLGKLFWTQKGPSKGSQGRIMVADLQMPPGTCARSRRDLTTVAKGLPEPVDLDIDDEEGAIYWTDCGELPFGNSLNKQGLSTLVCGDGQGIQGTILAQGFGEAIGLQVDRYNDCVWVADMCGRLWKCGRKGPAKKLKVFEDELAVFGGLAIIHNRALTVPRKIVCITGGNGFIGSRIVTATLDAGYAIRLVVRSSAKGEAALQRLAPHQLANVKYSVVADLQSSGALDPAFEGVHFVFHVASPLAEKADDLRSGYVEPAVGMVSTVLSTAARHASIKTVVITSSVVALMDPMSLLCSRVEIKPYTVLSHYDLLDHAGQEVGTHLMKYCISKIRAHQAMRDFITTEKPAFKVASLHPTFVIGHDPTWVEGTDKNAANQILMQGLFQNPALPPSFVAVQDVADAHVMAIESPSVSSGDEFVLHGPHTSWSEIGEFVRSEHPAIRPMLPEGWVFPAAWKADTRNTEEKLGLRCKAVGTAVPEVINQYAVLGKSSSANVMDHLMYGK
jgi:nucleoside-diphosphate-sugar epimerase